MSDELTYKDEAAAGYDRAFGHVTRHFVPLLLAAANVQPGMRVIDVATGTGLAALAALQTVGSDGHVTAVDLSPAMVEMARQRLSDADNVSASVADGQSLPFADEAFDAVLCSLGLMFFPDPQRGLAEFRRILRPGGRAAVMVNTVAERSYNNFINLVIAKHAPALADAAARVFALGDESTLRALFEAAAFRDVEISTQSHRFVLPSFDAYFQPFEQGAGSPGQAFLTLSEAARKSVRQDVHRSLGGGSGVVAVDVEYRIASGRR